MNSLCLFSGIQNELSLLESSSLYFFGITLLLLLCLGLVLYIVIDRKQRKLLEEQAKKMQTDIFAKTTHEFRTPLTITLGMVRQLRGQKELSTNSITYLNIIERQGQNLTELVNQLLDFANLYSKEFVLEWKTGNIIAFVEMIAETFRIVAEEQNINLIFYSEESEIEADFVPDYLNKILYNLLSNAIKYSSTGSRVYLTLERSKKDRKKIILKVIDQGEGIHPEVLPHIFDLFYTTPGKSSELTKSYGIGLALTKQLIKAMNGTIQVESNESKGSTFSVELPILINEKQLHSHWRPLKKKSPAEEQTGKRGTAPLPAQIHQGLPGPTLLLVEDNRDMSPPRKPQNSILLACNLLKINVHLVKFSRKKTYRRRLRY